MDDVRVAAGAPPPGEAPDAILSQTKARRWWAAMTVALFTISVGGTIAVGQRPWLMVVIMSPAWPLVCSRNGGRSKRTAAA